ncbi:MAG: DUF3221 domain-containing protein [Acidimicrobiia bacterium]|nr:DUF3221 domain-containing protein [Acidimicrobiia bacterium]
MTRRILLATLLLGLLLGACGQCNDCGTGVAQGPAPVKAPSGEPSVTGTITKVTAGAACADSGTSGSDDGVVSSDDANAACAPTGDGSLTFLVQDGKDPSGTALAASVRVPATASVLRSSGGSFTKASLDQLRDGVTVQIWFTGPVAESYPVQATAGSVVITS